MIILPVSELKHSKSGIAGWHNRLPLKIQTLVFNEGEYDVTDVFYEPSTATVKVNELTFDLPKVEPTSIGIAFDAQGREVVTISTLEGGSKGIIRFFNDLTKEYQEIEFPCTSIACANGGISNATTVREELVVVYTVPKDGVTEVWTRYQNSRYGDAILYCTVKGNKEIRMVGMTPENRFLIRFFERVEVVENA